MRDRIKIWLLNRRLRTERGIGSTYHCTYEGCDDKISTLRFLLVGCICKPHAWIRSWGG